MKFYVASAVRDKEEAQRIQRLLELHGHTITFDWTRTEEEGGHGKIMPDWSEHAWEATQHSILERNAVLAADYLILVLSEYTGGAGKFVEFGIACATGKPCWIVHRNQYPRDSVFFYLPNVQVVSGDVELDAWLRNTPDKVAKRKQMIHE